MRRWLRYLIFLAVLGGAAISALGYFYWHYHQFYEHLWRVEKIEYRQANGIKHAYAAGEIYLALTRIGFSDANAESMVLWLGRANERMEQVVDNWDHPDSTAEMMRDFYNNQAGLMAAQWHQTHSETSLKDTLIWLSQNKGMLLNDEEALLAPAQQAKPRDADFAIQWFEGQRPEQRAYVKAILSKKN